ncbi:MAG: hypothetical protein M1819_005822 [Sarea resinae]|nr:MAG: hypothetical protein M1819_005822 [Sarea resinae]
MANLTPDLPDLFTQFNQLLREKIDPSYLTLKTFVICSAVWFLVPRLWKIFQAFLSPLKAIPGPWLNKLSEWPFVIAITKGQSHSVTLDLHKRYGPIVVLAPGMISISDPQEIRRILVTEDLPKSSIIYVNFRQDPARPTLVSFTDKKAYGVRRRLVSSMFGLRYIRGLQPMMRDCVDVALRRLDSVCAAEGSAVVDVHHLIRSLAVDVIGVTTFGQSFNLVENGHHPLPAKIERGLLLSGIFQFVPWLKGLPGFPSREPYIDEFTRQIVVDRKKELETNPKHDLLQKLVEAVDDSPGSTFRTSDLQDETVILLTAGSETTANAEIFLLMLLAKHPEKLLKLQQEIDTAYPDPTKETTTEIELRYFQACVDETMRLFPAMAAGSPREATQDMMIMGYHVPKGTTIFPTTAVLHLDPQLWDNAEEFVPERWLEMKGHVSEMPYYPFSAGSRNCIGKHFAVQEIYLSVIGLLRRFDLEYLPGQDESTMFRVALQLKAGKYLIKFKPRKGY